MVAWYKESSSDVSPTGFTFRRRGGEVSSPKPASRCNCVNNSTADFGRSSGRFDIIRIANSAIAGGQSLRCSRISGIGEV